MFRLVITVLILYQVIGCLLSNDCDVLSDICRRDPDCADDEVFYSKCIESYGKGDTHDIVNQPVAWADKDHPDEPVYIEKKKLNYNHLFNEYDNNHRKRQLEHLKDVYSDYEKESIRESLILLKRKLDEQKDYVDVSRRFVSEDSNLVGSNIDHGSRHKDTIGKYVDIHNSDEDSGHNHIINSNLNDDSRNNNINNKFMDSKSENNNEHEVKDLNRNNDENDKNNYGRLLDSEVSRKLLDRLNVKDDELSITETSDTGVIKQNVANEKESLQEKKSYNVINNDASAAVETLDDEKKSKIINKAFDLVQTLIKEQGTQDSDILLATVSAADEVKQKVINKKQLGDSAKSSDESLIPILKAHDKSISVDIGKDRSEIAVPEYMNKDEEVHKEEKKNVGNEEDRGLVIVKTSDSLPDEKAVKIGTVLQRLLWNITQHKVLHFESVEDENNAVYRMKINTSWFKFSDNAVFVAKQINTDDTVRANLNKDSGAIILSAESTSEDTYAESSAKDKERKSWDQLTLFSAVIAASVLGLLFAAIVVCIIKRKGKNLTPLIFKRQEAVQDYQELCRTQMSVANSPRPEDETEKNGTMKTWNDEQSPYNMDITTGHVILAYMEDHLKNENRLNKEWEALCSYKADQNETLAGSDIKHATKNRYRDVLPYDHTRVKLRSSSNAFHSDYINASFITDTDPRNPSYIATQGPLDNTVADFWQMVWEQGVVVIINLTKLSDMGLPQCHHYWPTDGSEVYHIYEVHLISEHIWCDDYLVRSLYLKNLQTAETRTVTQFHYLTWPDLSIPSSPKPLLEFRRKVNKCYRGHACPVVVHCNNGVGRTGTYILLDMVLNKMIKGTKEIDIAATLEHLRDQRQDFVKTKGQFEFALLAVAEEVTAILSSVAR